jgi:hypothetical protein
MDTLLHLLNTLWHLLNRLEVPDSYPYLLGVLGLFLIWKFHDMQVKAGRIQARDFWERSGVRLFLYATPADVQACSACRETTHMVFLPSLVTAKKFTPQEQPCMNPAGCRCLQVGFFGGWPEAREVLARLKEQGGQLRLSDEELKSFMETAKSARAGASADRMSLRMLNAMQAEGSNPETAIEHYRYVLDHAEEDRDLSFMVPACLRLSELLEKRGRAEESLQMVERCLRDYGEKKKGPGAPTEVQRGALKTRQSFLAAKANKTLQEA